MFGKNLEDSLNQFYNLAKSNGLSIITVGHITAALLENEEVKALFTRLGINEHKLKKQLMDHLKQVDDISEKDDQAVLQPTSGFQDVLKKALFQVQKDGFYEVTGVHVILAILTEYEKVDNNTIRSAVNVDNGGFVADLLNSCGVSKKMIIDYLSSTQSKFHNQGQFIDERNNVQYAETPVDNVIEKYSVNLNKMAKNGEIDPVIGREFELDRCKEILLRRTKNNCLFVGEPGVGKTAVVEGLALDLVNGNVPEKMKDLNVYALNMGALLAGTKYRGDFEKRMNQLLDALAKHNNRAILFIDEIHTLIGAGAASGNSLDAANLLKQPLGRGKVRVVGATTFSELKGLEKDPALSRRFQNVVVKEPSVEVTKQMLKGLTSNFEDHHHIRVNEACIAAAVELSDRYINDRFLPDKAIDVIDEACSYVTMNAQKNNQKVKSLTVNHVEETIARLAQIPKRRVSSSDRKRLSHLKSSMSSKVFGQDHAIEEITNAIFMARSGLRDANKPLGSFLFTGPTGVGKTEIAVQYANALGLKLLRFDMSEYMEKHSASRLIGAPAGYVGFEQGGLLTDQVRKHPHCILLLDEIEKAHPDIYHLLLQVMDYGTLTDNAGNTADFRHATIIMTSNLGAQQASKNSIGFGEQKHDAKFNEAVNQFFAPEFRNRLDAVIPFGTLSQQVVCQVVDKFINNLEDKLEQKKVELTVAKSARTWFAERGYQPDMGARPMQRLIEHELTQKLAAELLFGRLKNGGNVRVKCTNGKTLQIDCEQPVKVRI
ncbi:MAG: AAA family ATPase [Candidatus Comchoanobacterales bacterium]